jgi:hypothetical protein
VDKNKRVIGVLSVHFGRPRWARRRDLQLMQWYGDLVGEAASANGAARRTRGVAAVS